MKFIGNVLPKTGHKPENDSTFDFTSEESRVAKERRSRTPPQHQKRKTQRRRQRKTRMMDGKEKEVN